MSMLSLRLPDSLHAKARELAQREDISLNQFIALAVAEKMSALLTSEYLEEKARRGSRDNFREILKRVPDLAPVAGDALAEPQSRTPVRRRTPRQNRRPARPVRR